MVLLSGARKADVEQVIRKFAEEAHAHNVAALLAKGDAQMYAIKATRH